MVLLLLQLLLWPVPVVEVEAEEEVEVVVVMVIEEVEIMDQVGFMLERLVDLLVMQITVSPRSSICWSSSVNPSLYQVQSGILLQIATADFTMI